MHTRWHERNAQLFKLLQTPLLAVVELVTGVRALSFLRGLLMVGVTGGVALAELSGQHGGSSVLSKYDDNGDGRWSKAEFSKVQSTLMPVPVNASSQASMRALSTRRRLTRAYTHAPTVQQGQWRRV